MRTLFSLALVPFLVLTLVPGWSGEPRLDLPRFPSTLWMARVPLDAGDPARRRVGRLTYLGGWHLTSSDPAFGGYSALAVQGNRVTLLSDGGTWLRLQLAEAQLRSAQAGALPDGPGIGWRKWDRDSESLALDPTSRHAWIGFENFNAIGRYSGDLRRLERLRRPRAMARWPQNGGPESLARLPDGRFLVLAEKKRGDRRGSRAGLIFAGDPSLGEPAFAFTYLPPAGYEPSDATALPDGRVIVLNRGYRWPLSFPVAVTEIAAGAIRPHAVVRGRELARLDAPLLSENFEGLAATRENGATVLWIVSDDNQVRWLERTLLLRFRLEPPTPKARALQ